MCRMGTVSGLGNFLIKLFFFTPPNNQRQRPPGEARSEAERLVTIPSLRSLRIWEAGQHWGYKGIDLIIFTNLYLYYQSMYCVCVLCIFYLCLLFSYIMVPDSDHWSCVLSQFVPRLAAHISVYYREEKEIFLLISIF